MSQPTFERLGVIGLGLVGGSVALGAQKRGLATEIRGVDPGLEKAAGIRLDTLKRVAAWADAIVLSVPLQALEGVMGALAPHLGAETVLTDTGSVKGPVAAAAHQLLPDPGRMVGAHPMAGGDASGFAHADADLFQGAACILALAGNEPPEVVDRIEQFWQGLGTFTVHLSPEAHDATVAVLSHAPHAIAYAFCQGLPEALSAALSSRAGGNTPADAESSAEALREGLQLAGAGLRDFTRIARANPNLWCEILLRNRGQLAEELQRFQRNFQKLHEALVQGDRQSLEAALAVGQSAVKKLDR